MLKAVNFMIGACFILMAQSNLAQETPVALSEEECKIAVANIKKSVKKHKRNLRKARDLSNIRKNVMRTVLAEVSSKATVDSCLVSEGKQRQGYQCMIENTDISDCRMNKSEDKDKAS